jgi:NACHT domain
MFGGGGARSWLMADGTRRAGLAAWLTALVVPPTVAVVLGKQFAIHYPVLMVVGVASEAVLAIWGFFAVIARDVSSRWQARLADKIDLFLQRKASRFERRYREFVLTGLRFMDHKGLATVGPFTPELDAVFVDVSLVARPPQQIGNSILLGVAGERAGRRALGDLLGHEDPALLAVVGAPGSGKTTLLRHAARQACLRSRSRKGRRGHTRDIPVLLYLRDHGAAITADPAVRLAKLLLSTLGSASADEPEGWLEQKLRDGRCLVLLDGLDEVARQDDRARVSAWAERQVCQYPGNDFVISSRPQGYQSAPVEGAEVVQVCGFTAGQIEDFVRGWYRAAERHSTGTAGPEAEALAEEGAADLLQRLGQTPALYDLAVNPLLLTMIANVHRYRGALPGSRADLYSEICQVMLWRRRDAKRLTQQVSGDKKEVILRSLAYTMMTRRITDLSRTDVLAEVQPALRRVSRGVTPDAFLADAGSDGLLIERETGEYAFAHKTFQEYLAAAHIRERGLIGTLTDAVGDDWWAETTLLYAAKSDADPIVRACLENGTAPALALAFDCAGDDSEVDPGLREGLDALVASAATPEADPERRRQISGTLLRQHTRQRVRTSGGSQVCPRPLPAYIYRLFLADKMMPGPDAPQEMPGTAVGMRSGDADAFIRWANDVSGAQAAYRLPLASELSELAVQPGIPALPSGHPPSVWSQADNPSAEARPALWLSPGTPDPREVSEELLASAIADDVISSAPAISGLLLLRARVLIHLFARDVALALVRDADHALTVNAPPASGNDVGHALSRARPRLLAVACALDIVRILDGVLARDATLTLAPALGLEGTLDLVLRLGGSSDAGLQLKGAPDVTHEPDSASALARARDYALDIGSALNIDVGRAFGGDQDANDVGRALARGRDTRVGSRRRGRSVRKVASTLYRDLDRALELTRDLDRALAGDGELIRVIALAKGINDRVDRHVAWSHLSESVLSAFDGALGVERAFSLDFTENGPVSGSSGWSAHLTAEPHALAKEGSPAGTLTADPASMEVALHEAMRGLLGALEKTADTPQASAWPSAVAERLQRSAGPMFARAQQPTAENATATRLAALCLASKADAIAYKGIGDMFRRVAAGITLLEHRTAGRLPTSEVIMLAVENPAFDTAPPPSQSQQKASSPARALPRGPQSDPWISLNRPAEAAAATRAARAQTERFGRASPMGSLILSASKRKVPTAAARRKAISEISPSEVFILNLASDRARSVQLRCVRAILSPSW